MKICVVSSTVFPVSPPWGTTGYAGLEVIAYCCARGLAELGHEVTLVAPDGSSCPGVRVLESGPAGATSEDKAHTKVWPHYLEVDCLIDHSWSKYSYLLKAERLAQVGPVLGVLHAPVHTMLQSNPPGVEKPCFVCISDDQRHHFEGLFQHPARTCHNGVDLDFYRSLGVPRTDDYLFFARFSTVKSPDVAVEVALRANVRMQMIGDTSLTQEPGLYRDCLHKAAASGGRIRVGAGVPRGEAVFLYSVSHALLHPVNRFREPFGLAPVEAQACGCPVVTFDNGAMRETVKHGETGFVVRTADEMVEVMQSNAVCTLDRGRCQEWASQFSLERMCRRYEALCVEAVEGGGW